MIFLNHLRSCSLSLIVKVKLTKREQIDNKWPEVIQVSRKKSELLPALIDFTFQQVSNIDTDTSAFLNDVEVG